MKFKLALAALAIAAGFAGTASASVPGYGYGHGYGYGYGARSWQLVGTREVRHNAENDRIFARGRENFRQIKVCAFNRAVRFYDLDVVFHNGGHQDVNVRHVLQPGECTRAVDLFGHRRDIRFVNMAYETAGRGFGPRAVVQVYAR